MTRKIQRLIGLILAIIMVISSFSVAYAEPANNSAQGSAGGHGGSGDVENKTAQSGTGYKIELVHITVDDLTPDMSTEEREEAIATAWEGATPESVEHIGKAIYLTNPVNNKNPIVTGFPESDFSYGLGTRGTEEAIKSRSLQRTGTTGNPTLKVIDNNRVVYPADLNSAINKLDISSLGKGTNTKYKAGDMGITNPIPIRMGYGIKYEYTDLANYFMHERTEAEKEADKVVTGKCYATPELAGLINYLATNGGKTPNNFIYFTRIYKDGKVQNYDDIIPEGQNCFESGYYKGNYGEYRLCVFPYWAVSIGLLGGSVAALTARDFAYLYRRNDAYSQIAKDQGDYYRDLCATTRLADDSAVWGLSNTTEDFWNIKSLSKITEYLLDGNLGGGISFFTSESAHSTIGGEPNYIGSISHIFLPGVLGEEQDEVEGIGIEYIGPKTDTASTSLAMEKAALSIAKALVGEEQKAGDIPFNSSINSSDTGVLLNGTIKLPGSSEGTANTFDGTYGNAERYAKEQGNSSAEYIKEYSNTL